MEYCNKEYVSLNDNEDTCDTGDKKVEKSECDLNLSEISRSTSIVTSVKILSENSLFVRIIVYMVFCNPFIRLLMNFFKTDTEKQSMKFVPFRNENVENILTERERKLATLAIIIILMIFNVIVLVCIKEYHLQAIVFFINNLYLLYFTVKIYIEESKRKSMSDRNEIDMEIFQ